jgi:hypothetical protein
MIYPSCHILDVSRALVGCPVCFGNTHSVHDVAKTIRQAFLRFGEGSSHEASFLRLRRCSRVFVRLV